MNIIEKAVKFEGILEGDKKEEKNYHSYSVISYIKKGEVELDTNNKKYQLTENSVFILSPLEEYTLYFNNQDCEYITLYLNLFHWKAFDHVADLSLIMKNRPAGFDPVFQNVDHTLYHLLIHCVSEFEAQSSCPYQNNRISHLISDFLIRLYRQYPNSFHQGKGNDRLMEIQHYMEDHYDQKLKMSHISNTFHINQFYFSHSFKSFSGYSPKQYLTKVQFIHVIRMLIYSDLTIGEIAEQTGFESTNDLSRKFKLLFSQSPTEFRKKQSK